MNELISIIITTHKRDIHILKRAIDSVLRQTYHNLEIIIINDYYPYQKSIDQLISSYTTPIIVFHNQTNQGACYSRNRGIQNANGKYIAFLDDDDEWVPEKLQEEVKLMDPKVAMVYCTGYNIYPNGEKKEITFIKAYSKEKQLNKLLYGNYMGGCSFPLIKTEVLRTLGGFDETLPSSQDFDLWIRITQEYKVVYLPKPLVLYYIMPDSITRSSEKRIQGYFSILKKHHCLYQRYPDCAIHIYNSIITVYVEHKEYLKTFIPFIKSFRYFPHNTYIIKFWFNIILKKIIKNGKSNREC